MASLFRRPRSKFWFAAFTDANGRRLKRSTKTTDKKEAMRIAQSFETAGNKLRTFRQVRQVLSDLSRELLGTDLSEPTVRKHIEHWLKAKEPSNAPATASFYRASTSKFLSWLGERADREISFITRRDIIEYRNVRASVAAPKTVNHEIKVLRMVFRAARKDGLIAEDPAEFVEIIKVRRGDETARRAFKLDELKVVLNECDEEWRSMVMFGLHTGQRLGDLAALKWTNLDLMRKEIRMVTQKTGKRMLIPMSAPLERHILSLSVSDRPDAPVHPRAYSIMERTGKTAGLSNQFSDILASAGLREKKAHRKTGVGRGANRDLSGLSFHSLRHTAVSMMKDAGVPVAAVMELIGHDSEQISQHYTHVGREALDKAAAALPDVLGSD